MQVLRKARHTARMIQEQCTLRIWTDTLRCSGCLGRASTQKLALGCQGPTSERKDTVGRLKSHARRRKNSRQSAVVWIPRDTTPSPYINFRTGEGYGSYCRAGLGVEIPAKLMIFTEILSTMKYEIPRLISKEFAFANLDHLQAVVLRAASSRMTCADTKSPWTKACTLFCRFLCSLLIALPLRASASVAACIGLSLLPFGSSCVL